MRAAEFLGNGFRYLHEAIREDLADLDGESLFWQPGPGMNHAGFLLWHVVRDEDDVVSFVSSVPQVWQSGGWHERFGMDEKAQGTGFESEQLGDFRYELPVLLEYAQQVWQRTETAMPNLTDADFARPAFGEWNVERLLNEGCLSHSWLHLGEMRYVRGLRGWRFRE